MKSNYQKIFCHAVILFLGLLILGCAETDEKVELAPSIDLGATIGSLVEVFSSDIIPVEGYSLVGGLNKTGSTECPPDIRKYLEQYILKQLEEKTDVGKLINSRNTAVVRVRGLMPAAAVKNQHFDIRIDALPGTQTVSLEGGWLYKAELKMAGSFGIATRTLSYAEGPVFTDTINGAGVNKKFGYVLAGGRVLDEYRIALGLRQPDYRVANLIRNRLNERFGGHIATAVSDSKVNLKIPPKYGEQKQRFISIVKSMYLTESQEAINGRIKTFVRKLAVLSDKEESEIALETIGNASLSKLTALLNSTNQEVRLRAARCMLNLGSDKGLETLRKIVIDEDSPYRIEALEAITRAASRNDAASISRRLLRDEDFDIRLAAYESLRKLDDIVIRQELIGRNFYLEQITQAKEQMIYVSRSSEPRIVLFGAPIYCRDNIFIQSADSNITINAPASQKYVSIIRKHPKRPGVIIQLKSSFELSDIIKTLCGEPLKKSEEGRGGLNVSYAEAIALLKQMSDKAAVSAGFQAGPMPKIDLIIKRRESIGR